jgi:Golgi apyrase
VLEDGTLGAQDFELAEADSSDDNEHSDSSEGSRIGRTSGLATPKMNVVNFDSGNYFDLSSSQMAAQSVGLGLGMHQGGMSAMDRSGLVVRTESRERLMLAGGRRSRAGSPTRMKSPLMTRLEEI